MKTYVSDRRIEEANADEQQERLYDQIAAELGQEVQATALSKMAKRVVNKFSEEIQKPSLQMQTTGKPFSATDYLREAIGGGKLSQVFDMIKRMDTTGLSKKEKIIVSDIKSKERRKMITEVFNERITPILEGKVEVGKTMNDMINQIENEFVEIVAGGDKQAIENILTHGSNPKPAFSFGPPSSSSQALLDGIVKEAKTSRKAGRPFGSKNKLSKKGTRFALGTEDKPSEAGIALAESHSRIFN